jgi:predicted homoserine dehydrogenase-like protein
MIIVDQALREREQADDPIQVGVVGAGYMGRGLVLHITENVPGMRAAAVFNRTHARAEQAYAQAGFEDVSTVSTVSAVETAITKRQPVIADDPDLLCQAGNLDVIVEATGTIEFGARVVLTTIEHGKHVVLMNAELDATIGPILKTYADRAGVVYTNVDGDQPGVVMNLYRFVQTIGCEPVVVGNIKGLLDHYRTPTTQAEFARKNKQDVHMVTSFADGTKLSMEQVVIANATGHGVARRGMYGPPCDHVSEALDLLPLDDFRARGGVTDYVLGADPLPGVFVIGYNENPILRQYASTFKMGDGPYYVFYVPYHLPHLETPITVARAALFHDATIAPQGENVCDVITVAKKDLSAGDTLDGIGGYTCYGVIENVDAARETNFLPMGLSRDCRLKRDVRKDEPIGYQDVDVPPDRLSDQLRRQQNESFNLVGAGKG